jgi:small subunit ribosomal protein S6
MTRAGELTPEYELVIMLDPEAPDERRDQIAADALKRIEAGGSLKHDRAWGMRKLAYEIRQRTEADYRFFRFESDSPLLEELDHNLKITDGVLRFRIFRVDSDSPVIEPPPPMALSTGGRGREGRRGGPGGRPPGPEAKAPEAASPEGPSPEAEQGPTPPSEAGSSAPEGEPSAAPEGDEQGSS